MSDTTTQSEPSSCYHCGEVVPDFTEISVSIDGVERSMCCHGCAAVAQVIHESGLSNYYRTRTARPGPVVTTRASHRLIEADLFDDELVQARFVHDVDGAVKAAEFIVQDMHCPACVWLIENRLIGVDGVIYANLNYSTYKLTVKWEHRKTGLATIVRSVQALGYHVNPYDRTTQAVVNQRSFRDMLRRMGVAGIFGMQVMILAVALYAGGWTVISSEHEMLFERLSLLLTLPVLLYAAAPIFRGAVRDLSHWSATMDVPVALGLSIAFVVSLNAVITGRGEVYFDSIVMFVFFQLVSRYFEHSARQRMTETITRITAASPPYANQLSSISDLSSFVIVPVTRLQAGDFVLVRPGESVPADGVIVNGSSELDESIITGESTPLRHTQGDSVIGGSHNFSGVLVVEVTRIGPDSVLAGIVRLLEQSSSVKPGIARLTDRLAGVFSVSVLLIAVLVAMFWWINENSAWVAHTIAVLVVACPCALSLAVPTALTVSVNSLVRYGVLVSRADCLQALAKADAFFFDKTGTLTHGELVLSSVEVFQPYSRSESLRIAAALALSSTHPIARALVAAELGGENMSVTELFNVPGSGIYGDVGGEKYFLGSLEFIGEHCGISDFNDNNMRTGPITCLASEHRPIAVFQFDDSLREDAAQMIDELKRKGMEVVLITGDRQAEADRIARMVGIPEVHSRCSPEDKFEIIRKYQQQGRSVAMLGDGINDVPILAAANVSVATASASQIVKVNSDALLTSDRLMTLIFARERAEQAVRTMRQNAFWAIAYNVVGISLAAAGYVPPVAAAIGMSLSSILVVGNSLRIGTNAGARIVPTDDFREHTQFQQQ